MEKINMVYHAYETVPIYIRIAELQRLDVRSMDFNELPIVDKTYYAESGVSGISSHYLTDYIGEKLIWGRTSGSTGKFTEIYWKQEELNRSLLELWMLRKRYYGISAIDRMCYFITADIGDNNIVDGKTYMAFSRSYLFNGRLYQAYEEMLRYDPVWMILQPSVAMLLCEIAQSVGMIPESLRYIEFTGEYLENTLRHRVERLFQCKTANQYGIKEVNSIAYECPEGRLHIMADNVFLETVKSDEIEELCVTTLQNHVMPLIRFNIEDRGSIQRNVQCPCGRCSDILTLQAGRGNDWIWRSDCTKVHAYALMQIFDKVNYQLEGGLLQYQILQSDYDKFAVTLVLDEEDVYNILVQEITTEIQRRLGKQTVVNCKMAKHILPMERTGKLACFQSECRGELIEEET